MPSPPDDESSRPRSAKGAARKAGTTATRKSDDQAGHVHSRDTIDCNVHDGPPKVLGKARAHYVTGHGGGQMLIVERRPGERLRINETTELVILEVTAQDVRVAIETVEEDSAG